jgi:hypothetical protein
MVFLRAVFSLNSNTFRLILMTIQVTLEIDSNEREGGREGGRKERLWASKIYAHFSGAQRQAAAAAAAAASLEPGKNE